MELLIFALIAAIALVSYGYGKKNKVIYFILLGAGAFIIMSLFLFGQGLSVQVGEKVRCIDSMEAYLTADANCPHYGYDTNASYYTYTQENNYIILLMAWLSLIMGILCFVDGLWLAAYSSKGGK